MRNYLLLFVFSILSNITFGQDFTHVVDKVATKICAELNTHENVDDLSEYEAKLIIGKAILEHKAEWDSELDKIENSRKAGQSIFDYLLNHKLQQNCEKFRVVDNKLDKYLLNEPEFRSLYLTVKEFVLTLESTDKSDIALPFFSNELLENKSELKLDTLRTELSKYKDSSGLYIMKQNSRLFFYVNIFNYKTGDHNVAIMINFNDSNDNLIDKFSFKTKIELEEEEREMEEEMESIPLPPPVPKN